MAPEGFHHRNTTKVSHKPFKSKHATKNFIKEIAKGKIESGGKPLRKTPHQQVMSKLDRRNQAKQKRLNNHKENSKAVSVFGGSISAPRNVAVVPLFSSCDSAAAIQTLHCGINEDVCPQGIRFHRTRIERFKQNIAYLPLTRDFAKILDACRVADFVVLVLSAVHETDDEAELILKTIENQGISNVHTVVQHLDQIPLAKRSQVTLSLKSYICHFFPDQTKLHSLDSEADCVNLIRSLCTTIPKGVRWREDRSWICIEDVQPIEGKSGEEEDAELVLTGVVRGQTLKANNLVQVGDWGHFQISKIVDATLPSARKKASDMAVDQQEPVHATVALPDEGQEDPDPLVPYDATMEDVDSPASNLPVSGHKGVLLDNHRYYSDDEVRENERALKLPKGTSDYQSAWFLGNVSDSGSDIESIDDSNGDVDMIAPAMPEDGIEGLLPPADPTEAAVSEYPQSDMHIDQSEDHEAEQLKAYRSSRKERAQEDREFPDEIELHPNVLARERLSKYRGLRSLRTSLWDESEDKPFEPEDWQRLLRIPNYKAAASHMTRSQLVGGIAPGQRVRLHLRLRGDSSWQYTELEPPTVLFSLLPCEQKRTVVNVRLTLPASAGEPLRAKSRMAVQIGPRRFVIHPIFSATGQPPNNVHRYLRFIHPGQTAVASFIAPHTWGTAVPALFFRLPNLSTTESSNGSIELGATGTLLPPGPNPRVVAKRAILTGHPFKIHRRVVTVRYMFFNKEDVLWFKALMLWTKRGRSGHIKESLGTHGYFKAEFDGSINPMDAIGISLYKRIWPKFAEPWSPLAQSAP